MEYSVANTWSRQKPADLLDIEWRRFFSCFGPPSACKHRVHEEYQCDATRPAFPLTHLVMIKAAFVFSRSLIAWPVFDQDLKDGGQDY
jgi:hypothetical protein